MKKKKKKVKEKTKKWLFIVVTKRSCFETRRVRAFSWSPTQDPRINSIRPALTCSWLTNDVACLQPSNLFVLIRAVWCTYFDSDQIWPKYWFAHFRNFNTKKVSKKISKHSLKIWEIQKNKWEFFGEKKSIKKKKEKKRSRSSASV